MTRFVIVAVVLPVAGVFALIGRAQIKQRSGQEFRLPISGYDPRDLLRGHYLTYRIDWNPSGDGCAVGDACCYCLTRDAGRTPVSRVACEHRDACAATISDAAAEELRRYYVPEAEAEALQAAVRGRRGELVIGVDARGRVAVRDLWIDGRPWREAIHGAVP
jgi:hypothetical protein